MHSNGNYNIHCELEIIESKKLKLNYDTGEPYKENYFLLLVHFNGGKNNGGFTWIPTLDEVQVIKDTLYYLNITQSALLDRYFKKKEEYKKGHD